ncbi:MAG: hypothetical protein C4329_05095 [Chitinophagaceae bacterium]
MLIVFNFPIIISMKVFLFTAFLLLPFFMFAQEEIMIDGKPCPINGNAKQGSRAFYLNEHKNRFNFPAAVDYDRTVTLERLLKSADPNAFSEDKAAVLTGYVYDVKVGGVETCNCKTTDPAYRDTHIELVLDPNNSGADQRVIAEITPRLRAIMADKEDWSTPAIRAKYKGHRVQIAGWLTYDGEHELEAFANDPENAAGRQNWRGTVWEVHPITSIKIVDDGTAIDRSTPQQQNNKYQKESSPKHNSKQLWINVAVVVLLLIIAFILLRKYL